MATDNPARTGRFKRFILFFVGLALLPLLYATFSAIGHTIPTIFIPSPPFLCPELFFALIGFILYIIIFAISPPNNKIYIWGHELTHAIFALLFGAKVGTIKVTEKGGYVLLSKSNLIITLAPYFFPFYLIILIILRLTLGLWLNLAPYDLYIIGLFGFAYSFHVICTIKTLLEHQPDIHEYGRLFSLTLLIIVNAIVLGIAIVATTDTTFSEYATNLFDAAKNCYTKSYLTIQKLIQMVSK